MRKIKFANEYIYHIYNRGVEKRKLFLDNGDKLKFISDLFEFNDKESTLNLRCKDKNNKMHEARPRAKLVEILAFVLMPNHFHLLLKQIQDDGIAKFMHKLGTGYAMFFNKKYDRTGILFQGAYQAKLIDKESYFIYLPYYIHLNPLELIMPKWKEKKINDYKKAIKFLEKYRWSSFLDYIGKKNFPSIIQSDFLSEFFESPKKYKKDTFEWLKNLNLENISDIILE